MGAGEISPNKAGQEGPGAGVSGFPPAATAADFAKMLLLCAALQARQAAGQRVPPSSVGQPLGAPGHGAPLQRGPAGVPPAPAGCGGDGGGRSSVVTNTPYTEITQGGQTCSTDLPAIGGL